jgi:uncharacterized coiled-coil protein SlyX
VQALLRRVDELTALVTQQQATIAEQRAILAQQQATIAAYHEQFPASAGADRALEACAVRRAA